MIGPLTDYTQYSHATHIYASGGIRIPNPSKLAAVDRRLTPCGGRDQKLSVVIVIFDTETKCVVV